jgi:hypothetical protein
VEFGDTSIELPVPPGVHVKVPEAVDAVAVKVTMSVPLHMIPSSEAKPEFSVTEIPVMEGDAISVTSASTAELAQDPIE